MHKIIFDCERMKYTHTGIYHYCLNLGMKLSQLAEPCQEQITFYLPPGAQGVFESQGKILFQHPLHKFHMPALNGYDIWHGTFQGSNYVPVRNKKIKVVLTIHDLNFLYDDHKPDGKKEFYLRRHQALMDRADVIVCVSEFSRKDVLTNLDTKGKPVHVIYNGTNTLSNPALSVNTYKPSRPFLFSIGVMNRKKNFHALLPLLQLNRNLELVISGRIDDMTYYKEIISQAEKLQVREQVQLTGQITENEKAWYFKNCNAFMCPSKAEGFGLPVAEAMSQGKPVFLSDSTALAEIGGDAAFYFSDFTPTRLQDKFISGMKQYKALDMKEQIQKRARDFSWQKAATSYFHIYRSLYTHKPTP